MNIRGNYEINQRARFAGQSYQQWNQAMVVHSPKQPSSMAVTNRGTIFSIMFGSILANISKPLGKRLQLSREGWKEAHPA